MTPDMQLPPGEATPRNPPMLARAGLIAKTATVSGPHEPMVISGETRRV